ncbi:MAG: RNA-binding S4 domain-containing protein [Rhodospirillaceae bacterium]|jgi:ribosome-associated heat shock protein Hsp15|nr:RNA-binding S4 domain-containing protein [Rhodospirillaceae bacterium]MBT4589577.1 RNA-binding S4 domain-containing protein [Rhodospirillaceae bacterium]MBT4939482.1 RNA-binding S4 domain-containing protein [Rhodospirillaceae bacterium]MBT5941020.1 RNA-binding S4 domain-containing protein [Rhodospirillaceae bacterium]MBT7265578.1 RNA-binding S4 domain-containing protein [Rhodospirillaceae bacterium]
MSEASPSKGLRLDKWLWQARFMKSRSLATKFCQSSKVRLNGEITSKAHQMVRPGDVLTFPKGPHIRVIKILGLGTRRGPATEAQMLYEDLAPPVHVKKEDREPVASTGKREMGAGRPTKTERRAIDKLMAKDEQWDD